MITARLLLVMSVVTACSRKAPPPPPPAEPAKDAGVARPVVSDAAAPAPVYRTEKSGDHVSPEQLGHGKTFMVVSEAPLATKVGADILASGGNAVDAAIATAFALAVVFPAAGNLGGGGFAVVRVASGKAVALDFRETAPGAATADMYLDEKGTPTKGSLVGHRASGVPGAVAGMWALHGKLGKKPWKELVEPAIALARDGFIVDKRLAESIERHAPRLLEFATSAEIWVPKRIPRAAGSTVAIPLLAVALERIRDGGADGFYKGETAAAIATEMKAGGGLITGADLAGYKAEWREPLKVSYRGHSLFTMPPPSSGGIVVGMTAGMLRAVELGKLPWHGYEHVHQIVEVWRRAFAARNELLGDPAFVKNMPVAKLLAQPYLDKLAATITPTATSSQDIAPIIEGDHTTNLCVVDSTGMAVALTTTLNTSWGSGVTIHGFLMNNEMDDFTVKPGAANTFGLVQGVANKIEPGKRMLSSMSPTIVEDAKGELRLVVGGAGGPRIITAVWQTISNVIDFGTSIGVAIAWPRFHHQHLPDNVQIEAASIEQATDTKLRAAGYEVKHVTGRAFGVTNAILRVKDGWDGAADPRGGGAAIGD
ncbi:MAG: gamma-glutamyltransferase [Deltaproteobacteria bacterium]|nr:gamma-glutamyltransferase [Deltaproteobacteria bacterium]